MICERLGCVAEAMPNRAVCVIHADVNNGSACDHCGGSGQSNQNDDSKPALHGVKVTVKGACPICAGTGLKDRKKSAPPKPRPVPEHERPMIVLAEGRE